MTLVLSASDEARHTRWLVAEHLDRPAIRKKGLQRFAGDDLTTDPAFQVACAQLPAETEAVKDRVQVVIMHGTNRFACHALRSSGVCPTPALTRGRLGRRVQRLVRHHYAPKCRNGMSDTKIFESG